MNRGRPALPTGKAKDMKLESYVSHWLFTEIEKEAERFNAPTRIGGVNWRPGVRIPPPTSICSGSSIGNVLSKSEKPSDGW